MTEAIQPWYCGIYQSEKQENRKIIFTLAFDSRIETVYKMVSYCVSSSRITG